MKLHAIAIEGLMDGPGFVKGLITGVERAMKVRKGSVNSASGRTAALAINYCERHDLDYVMYRRQGMYFVERIP